MSRGEPKPPPDPDPVIRQAADAFETRAIALQAQAGAMAAEPHPAPLLTRHEVLMLISTEFRAMAQELVPVRLRCLRTDSPAALSVPRKGTTAAARCEAQAVCTITWASATLSVARGRGEEASRSRVPTRREGYPACASWSRAARDFWAATWSGA